MKRDDAEWLACMVVASLGLAYALWVVPYLPTHDGPQHVLSVHIENHFADPGSLYPRYYRILPQYAGKGFALLFGPLEALMPWRPALRVALTICALAFAWGFALVVLALDRARRATSLLGFFIAVPWALYMGFFPFLVGNALGMFTLAFVLNRRPATVRRAAVVALMLLLQAVCHVFTAAVTGLVVAVVLVASTGAAQRARELLRAALIGAPAAGVLLATILLRKVHKSSQQEFAPLPFAERVGQIARWFVPGPDARAWLVVGLTVLGVALTLRRARREAVPATEKALAWLAIGFTLITLVAPLHIPGWQFFAPRFAITAAALGLALLPVPPLPTRLAQRAAVGGVAVLALVSSFLTANLHTDLARGCADSIAAIDAPVHFEGARFAISADSFCGAPASPTQSPVPHAALAENTPLLQLIDHGGIATTLFSGEPSIHAVAVLPEAPMPNRPDMFMQELALSDFFRTQPKFRSFVLQELAGDGMPFEGVQVVGIRSDDPKAFTDRGYVTEFQNASVFVARYEGCDSELVLPAGSLDDEPVYYEYGYFSPVGILPEPRMLVTKEIDRKTPAKGEYVHVPLAGRPCGDIWLRVVWDADSSHGLDEGERTCKSAGRAARVLAKVSRERPQVLCVPAK